MKTQQVLVRSSAGSYPVLFGKGLLQRWSGHISRLGKPFTIFNMSAPNVLRNWGRHIVHGCCDSGNRKTICTILFNDRESLKKLETVEQICRQLVRAGADRRSMLVAVGGGVVGDVAGYVAASFLRGVKLVHVPTTLVAQVD